MADSEHCERPCGRIGCCVPPHAFMRHEDPHFGSAFGGGCGAQTSGRTCGWPESAHARADAVRYMMATTAIHKLGDISRDEPGLCIVRAEDGDDFIGERVTGYGYINVRFPKATTRELTEEERARYDGAELELSGRPWGQVRLEDGVASVEEADRA